MKDPRLSEADIRATYRFLAHAGRGVTELRVITARRAAIRIGYFDSEDAFVRACIEANGAGNVYAGIQPRPPTLLGKARNRLRRLKKGARDDEIAWLTALVIDIDPARPKHTAATEEELARAIARADRISDWLADKGFQRPVRTMSGNGCQLWFAVPPLAIPAERREELRDRLKTFEARIREKFQGDGVAIDSIYNLSRIIKVIGTVSVKGEPTAERPHRLSCSLDPFERREDTKLLEAILTMPLGERPPQPDAIEEPTISIAPALSPWLQALLASKTRIRALFEGQGKTAIGPDGKQLDTSSSGYDFSLALKLALLGVTDPGELATALWHRPDGGARAKGERYIQRTVAQVLEIVQTVAPKPPRDSPPSNALKGEVFEGRDHYYIAGHEDEPVIISSFRIEPTARIRTEDGEVIVGDVTTDQGRVYRGIHFPPSAWHSKRHFLQCFPTADMQWTGWDDNVQGVLRILSRQPVPIRTGIRTLGYLETDRGPRWVAQDLVLGPAGPEEGSELIFLPNGSSFPERVRYSIAPEEEVRALARQVLPALLQLNEPAVVLPVLGWFFATPFKPRIMARLNHFPILMVWGTQGSGKSTLVKEVFWRLFGIGSTEPFSATETEFALIKLLSSTNAVPVFIDEYRPSDMPRRRVNTLQRCLRRVYGGEADERGRADLTVASYRLSAPVVMAGEARPDDSALVDRLISVMPNKNRLEEHPEHVTAYQRLRMLDLGLLAVPYLCFALGRNTAVDLEAAIDTADQALAAIPRGRSVSLRCRDSLRTVVFGLTMFEAFTKEMGIADMPALDLEAALQGSIDDLMDGEKGAKDPLDVFVETCSVLAYNGVLTPDRHYTVVKGLLCLHLRACWEVYLEHRRRTGQSEEASNLRALRRLLRENHQRGGYVKDLGKQVQMGEYRPRLIAIDLAEASQLLDLDELPTVPRRTWGGARTPSAA